MKTKHLTTILTPLMLLLLTKTRAASPCLMATETIAEDGHVHGRPVSGSRSLLGFYEKQQACWDQCNAEQRACNAQCDENGWQPECYADCSKRQQQCGSEWPCNINGVHDAPDTAISPSAPIILQQSMIQQQQSMTVDNHAGSLRSDDPMDSASHETSEDTMLSTEQIIPEKHVTQGPTNGHADASIPPVKKTVVSHGEQATRLQRNIEKMKQFMAQQTVVKNPVTNQQQQSSSHNNDPIEKLQQAAANNNKQRTAAKFAKNN